MTAFKLFFEKEVMKLVRMTTQQWIRMTTELFANHVKLPIPNVCFIDAETELSTIEKLASELEVTSKKEVRLLHLRSIRYDLLMDIRYYQESNKRNYILHLDSLNSTSALQRTAAMEVILQRKLYRRELTNNVFVVASTNRSVAENFKWHPSLNNRMCHIEIL